MKIGEIKIEALALIFPSAELEYDSDTLTDTLFALKENPSYAPYLTASVGAINRALAVIFSRLGIETEKITHTTSAQHELDISESVAQIIPYYVKADLLQAESPDESKAALEHFNSLLDRCSTKQSALYETHYSQEEILS